MKDKPEDYGEVIFECKHKSQWPYGPIAIAVVRIPPSDYYYPLMILCKAHYGKWIANSGERECVGHLLSIIAEKDKALRVILGLIEKYQHEFEHNELSSLKRSRQIKTAAKKALNIGKGITAKEK